jgi:hypothetical protein
MVARKAHAAAGRKAMKTRRRKTPKVERRTRSCCASEDVTPQSAAIKSTYGGDVGFRRFFAMITKGPKGDYIKGRIEHIDGIVVTVGENKREDGAIETALTEDNCKEWGYTDFTGAS